MQFPEFNLAYFTYAHIHAEFDGPMSKISVRENQIFGERIFEAFATLRQDLCEPDINESVIYGNAHGTGSAIRKSQAVYSAISEALERWAWRASHKNPPPELGLDIDPSTTGFAAYPAITHAPARKRALSEAAERWSLQAWWERKIDHRELELPVSFSHCRGIELIAGIEGISTIVLWKKEGDFFTYGFASSPDSREAIWRASIELHRNLDVLRRFYSLETRPIPTSSHERRLVFFSSIAGHDLFQRRLAEHGFASNPPSLLIDSKVFGPWSQYTKVWRCLFDPQPLTMDNESESYFLF